MSLASPAAPGRAGSPIAVRPVWSSLDWRANRDFHGLGIPIGCRYTSRKESVKQDMKNKHPKRNDLIVIAGGGGFIGGALVRYYHDKGFRHIRAVDKKPLAMWYQRVPGVECLSLDLSKP